ncbi:hypothetical protein JTE90_021115 [Oedothorax gibbosus]|uniref:Uncharacterized protein n=1 Tax=Oedothorax gibbosus TaxID=931172 RepID=A0AAV6TUK6_9ARAC|nr:hypothetical protein JTE90_021115 [Oedothorax gibbosus]
MIKSIDEMRMHVALSIYLQNVFSMSVEFGFSGFLFFSGVVVFSLGMLFLEKWSPPRKWVLAGEFGGKGGVTVRTQPPTFSGGKRIVQAIQGRRVQTRDVYS